MAAQHIKLQKQIRDNALEVNEYLKDIQDWAINDMANEMATNMTEDLITKNSAPIRGKGMPRQNSKPERLEADDSSVQKKAKRITGFDYGAWEKFDVEAACQEVDKEDETDPPDPEDEVRKRALEVLNKNIANSKKDMGNKCMQEKNYSMAIMHYTEGIAADPKNSILLANRAQAYINIQEFGNAAFDCDNALKIDPLFVKAYYRRARANFALGRIEKAQDDLKKVLSIEPQNKEARGMLNEIERTSRRQGLTTVKNQQIGNYINKTPYLYTNGDNEIGTEKKPSVTYPRIIHPIEKPPHLQSKRCLFSVYVKVKGEEKENKLRRIDSTVSASWSLSNGNNKSSPSSNNSGTTTPSTISQINSPTSPDLNELNLSDSFETMRVGSITIPDKPKTSVQFITHWKQLKPYSTSAAQYLQQMKAVDFNIFEDTMEPAILSDILDTLVWEFIPRQWDFTECLEGLTKIRRLKTLILLLTEKDRANARKLISLCPKKELQDFYLTTYKF